MADGSKTEKATPKKRRDERKKGNVFLSKDAVAVATLLGSFATFWLMAGMSAESISQFMDYAISQGALPMEQMEGNWIELARQGLVVIGKVVGPIIAATVFCSVAATFAQTKFLVSGEALKPKFNRISPLQGFKRLFSMRSIIEALKGTLKITILMIIIYLSLKDMFFQSPRYLYADVRVAGAHTFDLAVAMIWRISIAFVVLAAGDFLYQWWDYERQMRMSKQEIKEEYKQMEGDPQIKGKIKEVQRRMAQSRMMQQVPQSDVVIRNPTHFAVALRYRPERDAAPMVLAKGQDELALRIVKVAEENHVAIIENVPLARALYAGSELNREIPPEFYGAVAEVLVYIFRLDQNQKLTK